MDVMTSRPNYNNKKGNKENTQPPLSKSVVKRQVNKPVAGPAAPLHQKRTDKEKNPVKGAAQKALPQQGTKTLQKDGKGTAGQDPKKRQTLSQAFLNEKAVKLRKLLTEAPKPPAAAAPKPPAPAPKAAVPPKAALGTYKGRVVESKIGSIWKTKSSVGETDQKDANKPSASERGRHNENMTKARSKSAVDLSKRGTQKPPVSRSKSVCDGPPPTHRRPVTGVRSTVPPARTVPATRTCPSSSASTLPKTKSAPNNKFKVPSVTNKEVNKPPVSSSLSQYRVSTETAEERRAKLADWLASKGKTLKRPAMASTVPPKPKAPVKAQVQLKAPAGSQPAVQCQPAPELDAQQRVSATQPEENQKPEEQTTQPLTPGIMNTTMELLDNSDMDLPVDPEPRMEDIVVNLCDALEAMVTPSGCEEEPQQMKQETSEEEVEDGASKDEDVDEVKSDVCEEDDVEPEDEGEAMKSVGESDDQKMKSDAEEEDDDGESDAEEVERSDTEQEEGADEDADEEGAMETTPEMKEASVVKYSVKTTPYLQSVKRTIECDSAASGSRRKSAIKDLKFLTPVRRSCRIQQNSQLPEMLADHDPCVSSLAELVKLDADANAYIYRRNPALLEDLPDHLSDF